MRRVAERVILLVGLVMLMVATAVRYRGRAL